MSQLFKQALSAACLFGAGDTLAQLIFNRNQDHNQSTDDGNVRAKVLAKTDYYDPWRTVMMSAYGLTIAGPAMFSWYKFLDKNITAKTPLVALIKRVAMDQLLFAPTFLAVFFSFTTVINHFRTVRVGRESPNGASLSLVEAVRQKLRGEYGTALKANYQIWPAVQLVNFHLIPLNYRVVRLDLKYNNIILMCRFLLFKGREPILVADLLTRPAHSIINQSFDCKLRIDRIRPINGDGFGLGWYGGDEQARGAEVKRDSNANERPSATTMAAKSPLMERPVATATFATTDTSTFNAPGAVRVTVVDGQAQQTFLVDDDYVTSQLLPKDSASEGHRITATTTTTTTSSSSDLVVEETRNLEDVNQSAKLPVISTDASQDTEISFDLVRTYTDPEGPCVFTSILPAWNNLNLIRLSEKISSRLVFAHVRAASPGFPITETNCHPWCYGRFLWMHNGYIGGFQKIKRRLQQSLRDCLYHFVQGNTDSEWLFALFLNQFADPLDGRYSADEIRQAMLKTISVINQWLREAGVNTETSVSLLNFAVSDGKTVVCSRYVNSKTCEPASLYYSSGTRFERQNQPRSHASTIVSSAESVSNNTAVYRMIKSTKREDIIVIASEPLTYERSDWLPVPANTILVVTERFNLLIYPIIDEFYTVYRRIVALVP